MKIIKHLVIIGLLCGALLLPSSASSWGVVGLGTGAGGGGAVVSHIADAEDDANSTAAGASLSIAMPTGTQDGDIMIAAIVDDTTGQTWSPSGWTLIGDIDDGMMHLMLFYKIASSESGPYAFDAGESGVNFVCVGVISTFRKTGGTWDVDQAYAENNVNNTNTAITTTAITTTDNSIMIVASGNDGGKTISSGPDGMTLSGDVLGASAVAGAMYWQVYTTGSADVTKTVTWSAPDEITSIAACIDVVP